MKLSPAVVTLALCLIALLHPPMAPAMTQEEYQEIFDEGRAAFDAGRPGEAYDTFNRLFTENPKDPAVNFMLGRSAFELGMHEESVMIFERIIIQHPDNMRARLELGRTLMMLGDYENAKTHFYQVLESSPPDAVRKNIERYIDAANSAQQRHLLSGMLRLFGGWDDNPQVLPDDRTIDIPAFSGLSVQLDKKEDDWFVGHFLQLGHRYKTDGGRLFWDTSVMNYAVFYDTLTTESLTYVNLQSGPSYTRNNVTLSSFLGVNHMERHYEEYLDAANLSLSLIHTLSQQLAYAVTTRLERRNFEDDTRDSWDAIVGVQPIFTKQRLSVALGLRYETENTESDPYDLQRIEAVPALSWVFPAAITGRLSGRYSYSHYKGTYPLFNEKRRDHLVSVSTGLSREFWVSANKRQRLAAGLDHTWSKTYSSIDLYDYAQNRVTLSGTLMF